MSYRLNHLHEVGIPALLDGVFERADWEAKSTRIRQAWLQVMGGLPDPVPVAWRLVAEEREADHRRCQIRYTTEGGDEVPALLLIPERAANRSLPAVLALHPTDPAGKEDVATPQGRPNRRYGLELVRRGYVVLAPDTITAGERVAPGDQPYRTAAFDQAHPQWSAVGKMLYDHRQGLELLAGLEMVDPSRLGAIGHSLGAYNALFLAGIDPRVRAVVASCGLSPFTGDPERHRWGARDWFSHLPHLSEWIDRGEVPFEMHEVAALVAPAPLFVWSGLHDPIFPHWPAITAAVTDLANLYRWMGAGDRFIGLLGTEGHDFPPRVRAMAYAFLDQWLVEPPETGSGSVSVNEEADS